jgi:hypothetical protein
MRRCSVPAGVSPDASKRLRTITLYPDMMLPASAAAPRYAQGGSITAAAL